jgi:hypothetical protein
MGMSYREGLAGRLREMLAGCAGTGRKENIRRSVFMVSGHMCCGIVDETLIAQARR